jgi:hypothetical protein
MHVCIKTMQNNFPLNYVRDTHVKNTSFLQAQARLQDRLFKTNRSHTIQPQIAPWRKQTAGPQRKTGKALIFFQHMPHRSMAYVDLRFK